MRLGKDLEGKPLVDVAEGRILGRAKDVFVDPQLNHLVGLFVGMEGVIRRRAQVIASNNIVLYGVDVVLVKNSDVIVNEKDLPEVNNWQRLKDLQGREVLTPGGTKLGSVGDVILDDLGNIIGLHLSRVFVKGPLAEQGTIPRETIVDVEQEDGTIGVDLALLEKLVDGLEEEEGRQEASEPPIIKPETEDDQDADQVEIEEITVEIADQEQTIDDNTDQKTDEEE